MRYKDVRGSIQPDRPKLVASRPLIEYSADTTIQAKSLAHPMQKTDVNIKKI
jgi:hypothetical protein